MVEPGEVLGSFDRSFLMSPLVVVSPFGFRSTVASFPEAPVARLFPLCKDRRLSLGDQSRVAEPCEPAHYQPRVQYTRSTNIQLVELTVVISPLDPNHLAKFLSPLPRMLPVKFQDVRCCKALPSVEWKMKRNGAGFILSTRGCIR